LSQIASVLNFEKNVPIKDYSGLWRLLVADSVGERAS
jgi:hypothetical protein